MYQNSHTHRRFSYECKTKYNHQNPYARVVDTDKMQKYKTCIILWVEGAKRQTQTCCFLLFSILHLWVRNFPHIFPNHAQQFSKCFPSRILYTTIQYIDENIIFPVLQAGCGENPFIFLVSIQSYYTYTYIYSITYLNLYIYRCGASMFSGQEEKLSAITHRPPFTRQLSTWFDAPLSSPKKKQSF